MTVGSVLSDEKTPQGILCRVRIPKRRLAPPTGCCLLLDGVSDPGNMGAIIRTANAAGYCDIYLRNCADPFAPKCVRATMSGIFFVRLHIGEGVLQALGDTPLVCADMGGENIFSYRPPERFCLVIGNEANGVSGEVRAGLRLISVISLEPFDKDYKADFSLTYDTNATYEQIREMDEGIETDVPDIVIGGKINLGDIAIEQLALVMEDHPRKEGEEFSPLIEDDTPARENPFAVLSKLKK